LISKKDLPYTMGSEAFKIAKKNSWKVHNKILLNAIR